MFMILTGQASAQMPDSILYSDGIFSDKIKTVLLHKEGWNLSYPVMKLGSSDRLVISFDFLGNSIDTYYYTFVHCTKDWQKSDIFPNDYLEGFPENQLEEFHPSFNTTVNYIHYSLVFPNDRIKFKVSGNYVLVVYPVNNPEKPVLTRRFIITEDAVSIKADAHRPRMTADNNTSQQIDFSIVYPGVNITDPYRNIFAFILQNGIWRKSIRNLKPDFLGTNELRFTSLANKNIFPGGNEFRYFDIKSIRYNTEFVSRIEFMAPYYHVFLFPSENREFKPYFYWQDFNGKYYVAVQEGRNADTDADYVNVYFTLPSPNIVPDGKMYVSGALANWKLDAGNVMFYNEQKRQYECTMLLKQGWYNYEYVFSPKGSYSIYPSEFEGNHYETENDYLILVYYRNPRERFDRVIGSAVTNTLNRMSN
jgi:hypothetical protein